MTAVPFHFATVKSPAVTLSDYLDFSKADKDKRKDDINKLSASVDSLLSIDGKSPAASPASGVDHVDFHAESNAKEHSTEMYELVGKGTPIFRRGRTFKLDIIFKQGYEDQVDPVLLVLTFGQNNFIGNGTWVALPLPKTTSFQKEESIWDIRLLKQDRMTCSVQILIPDSCYVGIWKLQVLSQIASNEQATYNAPQNIYILFDPWNKKDAVYITEDLCQEYVLNECGEIFLHHEAFPVSKPWIYGQFADVVLPVCMYTLDKMGIEAKRRGDPAKVVRAISALVSPDDETGLTIGNWSSNYGGGTPPALWTGSTPIFSEYAQNGGKPVKYGHCYTFAALCTTMCRALGIPSRVVTNFGSAHDTNQSLTLDRHFNSKGRLIPELTETLWNFHSWSEVWMTRTDLPSEYAGWQVVDPTPQEERQRLYQTGPASVRAVKYGKVGYVYDTPYVFGQVNADVIHWMKDDTSDMGWKTIALNTDEVGKLVVTKKEGESGFQDITGCYKFPEGSKEERQIVYDAVRIAGCPAYVECGLSACSLDDQDVRVQLDTVTFHVGKPINTSIVCSSISDGDKEVCVIYWVDSIFYTGAQMHEVHHSKDNITLKGKEPLEVPVFIPVEAYESKLSEHYLLKIHIFSTVKETNQIISLERDIVAVMPQMKVATEPSVKKGDETTVTVTFQNPLSTALQSCHFYFEGSGLMGLTSVPHRDIKAGETITYSHKFRATKTGARTVVVLFAASKFPIISAAATVNVAYTV